MSLMEQTINFSMRVERVNIQHGIQNFYDYGKHEVIHFLLSNIKFWIEEYHFDGFRFDELHPCFYHHRGLGEAFTDYRKYFSMDTDIEAVTYLQFANELIDEIKPAAINNSRRYEWHAGYVFTY